MNIYLILTNNLLNKWMNELIPSLESGITDVYYILYQESLMWQELFRCIFSKLPTQLDDFFKSEEVYWRFTKEMYKIDLQN